MYCSFCGKEIEDGARFCNHCGAQLETGMQAGASGDAASVTSDATQVMPGAEFNSGATQVMPEAEHQSNPTQQMPQTPPAPDPNQLVTSSPFGPASNSLGNNTAGGTSSAPGMPGAPEMTGTSVQKQPLSRNAKIGIAVGAGVVAVAIIVVIVLAVSGFFNQSQSEQPAEERAAETTIIDKTDSVDPPKQNVTEQDSSSSSNSNSATNSQSVVSDSYTSSSIDGYSTYTNGRFGYSVAYPSDYVLSQEYEDGSGVIFTNASRDDMTITVWGQNNTYSEMAKSMLSGFQESIGAEGYTASGDDWFVYSYEMDGQVVYLKEYVGSGSMACMSITYPKSMSAEGDAMVETMEPTLEPGDISVSH